MGLRFSKKKPVEKNMKTPTDISNINDNIDSVIEMGFNDKRFNTATSKLMFLIITAPRLMESPENINFYGSLVESVLTEEDWDNKKMEYKVLSSDYARNKS
jgi:hypothetical protein